MTDKGARRGWSAAEREAWWDALLVVGVSVGAVYVAYQTLRSAFQPAVPGLTYQAPGLTSVKIAPHYRGSVNLSLGPDPNGQLPSSVDLVFDASASLSFTPASGIIVVMPTPTGAKVTAVGQGSAMITVVFGGDTSGLTDAIVGIGVF